MRVSAWKQPVNIVAVFKTGKHGGICLQRVALKRTVLTVKTLKNKKKSFSSGCQLFHFYLYLSCLRLLNK